MPPAHRKLNRYTRATFIAFGILLLINVVLGALIFLAALQTGDLDNSRANIALTGIVLSWFVFFVLDIYFSVKTLSTINKTEEVGKTFAWISLIISVPFALWLAFWIVFAAAFMFSK